MTIQWLRRGAGVVLIGLLSACSEGGRKPEQGARPPAVERGGSAGRMAPAAPGFGTTPQSYRGVVPCADCPGIETLLNVWPDGIYQLRMVYQERAGTFDEIGRWELTSADSLLRLRGSGEAPRFYRLIASGGVRQLDREGKPIDSNLDYELKRLARVEAFEPRLRLRGIYQLVEEAAWFRDCATQRPLPILPGAAADRLKGEYLKADAGREREMAAVIEVRIVARPAAEGAGPDPAVVVERFFELNPTGGCGPREAAPELEDRFWRVTQIGARDLGNLAASRRVPGFRLASAERRLIGFSTCNRLTGGYTLGGPSLRFSDMASTQMACPDGMEFESAFLEALGATASWRITGETLELGDARGATLARFVAVAGE